MTVGPLIKDKEMCEVLNEQYCSVFTREDLTNLPEIENNFHFSENNELKEIIFTREKVRVKLARLKPCSAPGPDKLWPRVLQRLSSTLCIPLAIIFSTCMKEGSVPPDWKLANVTPIFKKGSKGDPHNFDLCLSQGDREHHQGQHC